MLRRSPATSYSPPPTAKQDPSSPSSSAAAAMSAARVSMEVFPDGVAVITISNPPVNAIHPITKSRLKQTYTDAMARDDVKVVVLTGEGRVFSGGFDINVMQTGDASLMPEAPVDLLASIVEDAEKPSVAAIRGLALGGGLELAMVCHARISTPEAQLGLPELKLGIIPGFGGTQRLPRLVGLPKAIEMMLLSKPITATEGMELGLIDAVVSSEELMQASRLWALEMANGRKPWISSLCRNDRLCSLSEAREILQAAKQQAKTVAPNMPQHHRCLDVVEEGVIAGGYAGFLKEATVSKELVSTSTSKGLIHVFFSQRATSKVPKVTDVGLKPRKINKVAVIGGGLMGSGIATALVLNNIAVILKEINSEYLQKGIKSVAGNLEGLVKKGSLTQEKMDVALSRLKGVLDYSEFKHVDMVIEAVIENTPLKQSIFSDIEKACSPHCILATNTSTIDLNVVGGKTSSQDRIVGAHFFSPAHVMPLLEIVRTEKTSPQVILDLMTFGKTIKKVPVVVGNCTGFAVNRTFSPYHRGAQMLVHLGVDLFRVDRVINNFGMPMGPFQLRDVGGYGMALAVKKEYQSAFKGRTFEPDLVELMVENGRNGKINGKGFYIYQKGSKPKQDPSIEFIIEESRRRANIMPGGKPITVSDQEILEMILFPVVNEACRVIDDGVVLQVSDLDIASVLGMGFPNYRGGLMFWADTVGSDYIYSKLSKWEEAYGGFFKPSSNLEERAKRGLPLSTPNSPLPQSSSARL